MTTDDGEADSLASRLGVYTDRESLPTALGAAARSGMALVIRDHSEAHQIRPLLDPGRQVPIIVDPGRWRHTIGSAHRAVDINRDGLSPMRLAAWATAYCAASGADRVLTPSLFVPAGHWGTLRVLRDELAALPVEGSGIGLIATDAAMLDPGRFSRLLTELAPLRTHRLAFVFTGGREALARSDRLAAVSELVACHGGAWLIGVDALVASDVLSAGAGFAAVGLRSGMRWPASPDRLSNDGFALGHVPGRLHRDLLTYRSPVVYSHWYFDSVPSACGQCGRPPHRFVPSPEGKNEILAHNVHAAAALCTDVLSVDGDEARRWLSSERLDAADRYRELDRSQTETTIDRTLVALIRRDMPGWTAPARV